MQARPNLTAEQALDREGATQEMIKVAQEEHEDFVMKTHRVLVEHNVARFGSSSLSTICRIDVGIILNPATQKFEYLVNEVKRGCAISWFSGRLSAGDILHAHTIADQLLPVILELIDASSA